MYVFLNIIISLVKNFVFGYWDVLILNINIKNYSGILSSLVVSIPLLKLPKTSIILFPDAEIFHCNSYFIYQSKDNKRNQV